MVVDPLADTPWSTAATVAGFATALPNDVLMAFARAELERLGGTGTALDIGCGAARNAVPLAAMGWFVTGTDLSSPMLDAAAARARDQDLSSRVQWHSAPMERLPVPDATADLVIAHGIWNLASSSAQFRQAVREGARVAKPGAALFVFTFSRHTLPDSAAPVAGEPFVFTQFSGQPQCFLTEAQLIGELQAAGFHPDPAVPLRELNRPAQAVVRTGGPVIYEAAFRRSRMLDFDR
ncbi:MAG: class I SAM-dependent methyltransferase [Vicinamibacterales bacterium]|nr:class I SAM-dependent methyltransferase [Vicinamibacterales bacterium]